MFKEFTKKIFSYGDTHFTRTKEGETLPATTPEQVRRLNSNMPWADWGGIRLSQCRCFFVRPDGRPLLFSTVRRILGSTDGPTRLVVPILSIPNGQVKNFLNACRAVGHITDQMRIAVVGSKSSSQGGTWHQYFIQYLMMFGKKVIVDFFDYSEIEEVRTYQKDESFISAEWVVGEFTQSDASKYDLIIDDTWMISKGPGLKLKYSGKYSWKGTGQTSVPFLHETEERSFSEKPRVLIHYGCQCPTCRVIQESVDTYEQYLYVRSLCARLGYLAPCEGINNQEELEKLFNLSKDLNSKSVVEIDKKQQLHLLTALSEEMGLELRTTKAVKKGDPQFKNFSRFASRDGNYPEAEYFFNKHVIFSGVEPSILEGTKTVTTGSVQILFAASIDSWRSQVAPDVVFCSQPRELIEQSFPNFEFTGRSHKKFLEFVRKKIISKEKIIVQNPCVETQQSILKPLDLVHRMIGVLGTKGKPQKDFVLRTLKTSSSGVLLVPFDPSKWRKSVYVNKDNTWGPVKLVLEHIGRHEGFLNLDVPLPWDMTPLEVDELEQRLKLSIDERRHNERVKVFPEKLNTEWLQVGKWMKRHEIVHPVSWRYFDDVEETQRNLSHLGYLKGYDEIVRYVKRLHSLYDK